MKVREKSSFVPLLQRQFPEITVVVDDDVSVRDWKEVIWAMTEVVGSIRCVTDTMGDITAASTEQSQGVTQIGEEVQQMDQVTQQNAA